MQQKVQGCASIYDETELYIKILFRLYMQVTLGFPLSFVL